METVTTDLPIVSRVKLVRRRFEKGDDKLVSRVEVRFTVTQREQLDSLARKLDVPEATLLRIVLELLLKGYIETNTTAIRAIDLCGGDPSRLIRKLVEFDAANSKLKLCI